MVTLCDWEGNRRSGIALAIRYRLQWSDHLRAQCQRTGDEQPAYVPMEYSTIYLYNAEKQSSLPGTGVVK